METLAQFIGRLAAKAGIAKEDANLAELLKNTELEKITMPEELLTGIDNSLLSLAQAVDNHPKIKKHYQAQALNGVDARVLAALKEAGLSAEKLAEVEAESNTYQRLDLAIGAIREAATAASKKNGGEDKSALQKQVEELLASMKAQKTEFETKLGQLSAQRQKDLVGYEVKAILGTMKTVFDELPPTAKTAALDSLIAKALQEHEAGFELDETGVLQLRGKDGAVVVAKNNSKYTPTSFMNEVLAQNKILKVNEPAPQPSGNGNPSPQRVNGSGQPQGNSQDIMQANLEALQLFQKNTAGVS